MPNDAITLARVCLVIIDSVILSDEQVLDQQLYMLRRTAFSDAMHVCCAISTTGHGAGALTASRTVWGNLMSARSSFGVCARHTWAPIAIGWVLY
jgi:hypothetical protein